MRFRPNLNEEVMLGSVLLRIKDITHLVSDNELWIFCKTAGDAETKEEVVEQLHKKLVAEKWSEEQIDHRA
jgi:hypothetical protein